MMFKSLVIRYLWFDCHDHAFFASNDLKTHLQSLNAEVIAKLNDNFRKMGVSRDVLPIH